MLSRKAIKIIRMALVALGFTALIAVCFQINTVGYFTWWIALESLLGSFVMFYFVWLLEVDG